MKKLALMLAMLGLLAPRANATMYHVRMTENSSDQNSGKWFCAPWRTIGKANNTVVAGDTVVIWSNPVSASNPDPGYAVYNDAPDPENGAGGRIWYLGAVVRGDSMVVDSVKRFTWATDSTRADSVRTGSLELYHPYAIVKYISPAGLGLNMDASRDTVKHCLVRGKFGAMSSDYCLVDSCIFVRATDAYGNNTGASWLCVNCTWYGPAAGSGDLHTKPFSRGLSITNNIFWDMQSEYQWPAMRFGCHACSTYATDGTCATWHTDEFQDVESLYVSRNRFFVTINHAVEGAFKAYHMKNSTWYGNYIHVARIGTDKAEGCEPDVAMYLRDSTEHNVFRKDTLISVGVGTTWSFSTSGSFQGTCHANTFDSLYCYAENPASEAAFRFQDGLRQSTVSYSFFACSTGTAMRFGNCVGPNTINHNDFVSGYGPVVSFIDASFSADTTKFYNNLMILGVPDRYVPYYVTATSGQCGLAMGSDVSYRLFFKSNWNAYQVPSYNGFRGSDMHIVGISGNSSSGSYSSNTFKDEFPAGNGLNGDSLSVSGFAALCNNYACSFGLGISPELGNGSVCRGAAKDGSDIGCYVLPVTFVPDVPPPVGGGEPGTEDEPKRPVIRP